MKDKTFLDIDFKNIKIIPVTFVGTGKSYFTQFTQDLLRKGKRKNTINKIYDTH